MLSNTCAQQQLDSLLPSRLYFTTQWCTATALLLTAAQQQGTACNIVQVLPQNPPKVWPFHTLNRKVVIEGSAQLNGLFMTRRCR
jgi:hypothetical protein